MRVRASWPEAAVLHESAGCGERRTTGRGPGHHVGMRIRTATLRHEIVSRLRDDRGDVPGWVLISLMTAGLVIAIWAIAGPALGAIFESALARVTGF